MVQVQTIHQAPNAEAARIKAEFEAEGAMVTVTPDGPNTSTLVATFPNSAALQGAAARAFKGQGDALS
jgi:hypothetical protein